MTTTVPQLPQVPQKTQPPQGAPSSVNNPAFNSQQVAQSAVHPAQFAQPVYVLPEQENTHTLRAGLLRWPRSLSVFLG